MVFRNGENDRACVAQHGVDEEGRVKEPGVVQVLKNADRDERVKGRRCAERGECFLAGSQDIALGRARREGELLKANAFDVFRKVSRDAEHFFRAVGRRDAHAASRHAACVAPRPAAQFEDPGAARNPPLEHRLDRKRGDGFVAARFAGGVSFVVRERFVHEASPSRAAFCSALRRRSVAKIPASATTAMPRSATRSIVSPKSATPKRSAKGIPEKLKTALTSAWPFAQA